MFQIETPLNVTKMGVNSVIGDFGKKSMCQIGTPEYLPERTDILGYGLF